MTNLRLSQESNDGLTIEKSINVSHSIKRTNEENHVVILKPHDLAAEIALRKSSSLL